MKLDPPATISLTSKSASTPAHTAGMQIVNESTVKSRFTSSATMRARYYDCFAFYKTLTRPFPAEK